MSSQPRTPLDTEDEAIVYEQLRIPGSSQDDSEMIVKKRPKLSVDDMSMGQAGDYLVHGNPGGHGILEELYDMKGRMDILEKKVTAKDDKTSAQIFQQQQSITFLESRVRVLSLNSKVYIGIRERFIDSYKRCKGGSKFTKAIDIGNKLAHEGDAILDATLWDQGGRTDRSTYRELYGLEYTQVLEYSIKSDDPNLFAVLNKHATLMVQTEPIPEPVETAFQSFLEKVEEHWLDDSIRDPISPLGRAYYTFWRAVGDFKPAKQSA